MLQRAYDAAFAAALSLTERDVVPDALLRKGIRYLLSQRVKEVRPGPAGGCPLPAAAAAATAAEAFRMPLTAALLPSAPWRRPPAPGKSTTAGCRPSAMSWRACRWRCRCACTTGTTGPTCLPGLRVPAAASQLPAHPSALRRRRRPTSSTTSCRRSTFWRCWGPTASELSHACRSGSCVSAGAVRAAAAARCNSACYATLPMQVLLLPV